MRGAPAGFGWVLTGGMTSVGLVRVRTGGIRLSPVDPHARAGAGSPPEAGVRRGRSARRRMRPVETERASRTAVLVCQGRACADGRTAVGSFSDPVAVRLLRDDERRPVEQARAATSPSDW